MRPFEHPAHHALRTGYVELLRSAQFDRAELVYRQMAGIVHVGFHPAGYATGDGYCPACDEVSL